jgi:hypothetical protein
MADWLHKTAQLALLALLWTACDAPLPTEGSSCANIADCAAATQPLSCADQRCQRIACTLLAQCPIGAACVAGVCQVPECAEDQDCEGDAQCYLGECRDDLCRSREDCPANTICGGTPPRCIAPPATCARDTECPSGTSCDLVRSVCDRPCRLDAECAPVGGCRSGFCRARCTDDEGCDSGEVCGDGVCQQPTDCAGAEVCGGATPLRDPISCACQQCLSAEDCGDRQQRCDAGVCRTCIMAVEDAALCAAQGLLFEDGCCIACRDDTDCDAAAGERCTRNLCIDTAQGRCVEDTDCPNGTICDGLRCAPAASLTPCALQTDCPDGEACYPDARCRREASVCAGGQGCPDGTRCVAEPGDTLGACLGCNTSCGQTGCPDGTRCALPSGSAEGACAALTGMSCGS